MASIEVMHAVDMTGKGLCEGPWYHGCACYNMDFCGSVEKENMQFLTPSDSVSRHRLQVVIAVYHSLVPTTQTLLHTKNEIACYLKSHA